MSDPPAADDRQPARLRGEDILLFKICVAAIWSDGSMAAAERQLSTCEGSDWFWWLGPHNPQAGVARFDRLFRHNLRTLYQLLGLSPPNTLDESLNLAGAQHEGGGAMRRAQQVA